MPRIAQRIIISAAILGSIYGLRSCGHADPDEVAHKVCAASTTYEALGIINEADDDGWDSGEADQTVELIFQQCPNWASEIADMLP